MWPDWRIAEIILNTVQNCFKICYEVLVLIENRHLREIYMWPYMHLWWLMMVSIHKNVVAIRKRECQNCNDMRKFPSVLFHVFVFSFLCFSICHPRFIPKSRSSTLNSSRDNLWKRMLLLVNGTSVAIDLCILWYLVLISAGLLTVLLRFSCFPTVFTLIQLL